MDARWTRRTPKHGTWGNLHIVTKLEVTRKLEGYVDIRPKAQTLGGHVAHAPCASVMDPHVLNIILAIGRPGRAYPTINSEITLPMVRGQDSKTATQAHLIPICWLVIA